ncbi:solute carrier family 35 member E2A-like [Mytilus galloprovincialis]|uniref:solute carrier family 35 member E2A-like n=1 Tax=Mytilus galloprovincialis TaxID=29158 RepID=UPI003F7C8ECA
MDVIQTNIGTKHKVTKQQDADDKFGLYNVRAFLFLIIWYIFSAFTLFLNKYILSSLKGDPAVLGGMQMVMTTIFGFMQMNLPSAFFKAVIREGKPPKFWENMILLGCMRFCTVFLGLVALKHVAVSLTETVKSSAPLLTCFISYAFIGEYTGMYTFMSLIPIMSGLALCSAYELSFNIKGFIAALATNLTDCLQNVYSKSLISGEKYRYTPVELQFYTSMSSLAVQIPACYFMIDMGSTSKTFDTFMFLAYVVDGICFHFQSLSAYVLMSYISPVTHSVANTVKRALLIWISILLFGNPMTFLSGLGTVSVTIGVLLYTKAKEVDHNRRELIQTYPRLGETKDV